ncbi:MAG: hypothetical protein WCO06_04580 [Candidatus Roizmanbacteria bacterium]
MTVEIPIHSPRVELKTLSSITHTPLHEIQRFSELQQNRGKRVCLSSLFNQVLRSDTQHNDKMQIWQSTRDSVTLYHTPEPKKITEGDDTVRVTQQGNNTLVVMCDASGYAQHPISIPVADRALASLQTMMNIEKEQPNSHENALTIAVDQAVATTINHADDRASTTLLVAIIDYTRGEIQMALKGDTTYIIIDPQTLDQAYGIDMNVHTYGSSIFKNTNTPQRVKNNHTFKHVKLTNIQDSLVIMCTDGGTTSVTLAKNALINKLRKEKKAPSSLSLTQLYEEFNRELIKAQNATIPQDDRTILVVPGGPITPPVAEKSTPLAI